MVVFVGIVVASNIYSKTWVWSIIQSVVVAGWENIRGPSAEEATEDVVTATTASHSNHRTASKGGGVSSRDGVYIRPIDCLSNHLGRR